MIPPSFVIRTVERSNRRSSLAVLGNSCIVQINIAGWPVDRYILAAKHKGAILVSSVNRDGAASFSRAIGGVGMRESTRSSRPFVRCEIIRRTVTPVDAVPCSRVRARVNDRTNTQGVSRTGVQPVNTRHQSHRSNIVYRHLKAACFDTVGLALLVVCCDRHGIDAIIVKVVTDVQAILSSIKNGLGSSVTPVHDDMMCIRVRIAY